MVKVILIYGSTTGNTEALSESVKEGLESSGAEVTVKEVSTSKPEEMNDYDGIVLGCSTWGAGELQDDFIEFEEGMKKVNLKNKKAAVFGPGDSEMYEDTFCEALDILEKRLKDCGAEIIIDSLEIDGDIETAALEKAKEWGKQAGQIFGK